MLRSALMFAAALALVPAPAAAVNVRDIIELTRAGVGEEILLALVEVDRSIFPIDTETLKALKQAGVSERVILAMIRSARTPVPEVRDAADVLAVAPPQRQPQVIVIEHEQPPQVLQVPVAVPVYIPVAVRPHGVRSHFLPVQDVDSGRDEGRGRDHGRGEHAGDKQGKPAEPVYWGWGGKLRPDAWKPK